MKTNKIIAAALLPLMFACTKENIGQPSVENGKFDVTINVSPEESKAYMDEEHGLLWKKGDYYAGIVKGDKNLKSNKLENVYPYPNVAGNPANQASFTWTGVEEMGDYKFYYPYHNESTAEKLVFWVPVYSKANFGTSEDIFTAVSTDLVTLENDYSGTPNTVGSTKYKVVGSYIRIAVYGKEDETVTNLHIKGSASSLHGKYFIDPQTNEVSGYEYNGDDIVVDFLTPEKATGSSKDDAHAVYVPVLPGKSSKNTYIVATSKGFYKFESASELEFKNGAVYDIPLNLSSSKAKFSAVPEKLYIVGDATIAGWNAGQAIELTKVEGENKFVADDIVLMNGGEGFKFLTESGSWNNSYVNVDGKLMFFYDPAAVGKDNKFKVEESAFYNLTVDFDTMSVSLQKSASFPILIHNNSMSEATMTTIDGKNFSSVIYIMNGNGTHDLKLKQDGKYWHVDGFPGVSLVESVTYKCSDLLFDETSDKGWFIWDEYCHKNYRITLNVLEKYLEISMLQGQQYWLVGGPFDNWSYKNDNFKETVNSETGIVTWENVNIDLAHEGQFRIFGENTRSDSWWYGGEIYCSENQPQDLSYDTPINAVVKNCENNWNFTEAGKYTIQFDTRKLKLTVSKVE